VPEMPAQDLVNSLNKLISFLKRTRDYDWVRRLEKQRDIIIKSNKNNDIEGVKESVNKIKSFYGRMGSLSDLYICRENHNVPRGLTANVTNRTLSKLLNELFVRCYFWEMDKETAMKLYSRYMKTYKSSFPMYLSPEGDRIEAFLRMNKGKYKTTS
jgi:hypothetical protein